MLDELLALGAKTIHPKDKIILVVEGDFNDADCVQGYWEFAPDDIQLVIWLLKLYAATLGEHWDEAKVPALKSIKARRLFRQYLPQADDGCWGICAHTVHKAHAYVLENGTCVELDVSGCKLPKTVPLYDAYYEYAGEEDYLNLD